MALLGTKKLGATESVLPSDKLDSQPKYLNLNLNIGF